MGFTPFSERREIAEIRLLLENQTGEWAALLRLLFNLPWEEVTSGFNPCSELGKFAEDANSAGGPRAVEGDRDGGDYVADLETGQETCV